MSLTVIDRLPRLQTTTLRPLFQKGRELLSDEKYRNRGLRIGYSLKYDEIEIELIYAPEEMSLLFKWEYKGEKKEQTIKLMEIKSNLGISSYLSFICPYSGKPCRKLYTDWRIWIGRKGFKHTYLTKLESKKWRDLVSASTAIRKLEKIGKMRYRKLFYNGNPTKSFRSEMRLIRKGEKFKEAYAKTR